MTVPLLEPWASRLLHVDLRVQHATAEVLVNDLPVCRVHDPAPDGPEDPTLPRRACVPTQHAWLPGPNRLRLVVSAPAGSDGVPRSARAAARLVWLREGDFQNADTDGEIVATAQIDPASDDPAAERPLVAHATVDVGGGLGVPAWSNGAVLSVDEALLDEAERFLRSYASALEQGDTARLATVLGGTLDELARAYPTTARETFESMHDEYIRQFRGGEVEIAARSQWMPRLCGEGRVLDLRRRDGRPAVVHHQPDDIDVTSPFMIAWAFGAILLLR